MANRRKYLLYPYNDQSYGLAKGLFLNDENIDIIAPIGTGLVDKDMAYSVNRNEMKKIVKSIKEIEYKNYDTLIISSHISYKLCRNEILEIINHAKKENMEINYLGEDEEVIKLLESYDKYSSDSFENIKEIKTMINRYNQLNLPLYNPKTPIVYIGGLLETIDSFDIALQMKLTMEKLGYKVALITKELDGRFFGATDYPKTFMNRDESIENQILSINRWIRAIDYIEKPDIILMDIPKGMMQYSNSFYNTFGIYTYMIAQTIPLDYLILTIPQTVVVKEYIEEIDQYFKNTIGIGIDVLNITNAIYDIGIDATDAIDKPLYTSEKDIDEMILENKDNYELNLTNLNIQENIAIVTNNIIGKFS